MRLGAIVAVLLLAAGCSAGSASTTPTPSPASTRSPNPSPVVASPSPVAGTASTVGSTGLIGPSGLALDAYGILYIADAPGNRVFKLAAQGNLQPLAGTGTSGYGGDGGPATAALLASPTGVAVDRNGNVFISDTANHRIRKVAADGTITTVVGTGVGGYSGDNGPATAAQLFAPTGLAIDAAGNLYIADTLNNVIRMVSPAGTITTFAGSRGSGTSGDGGPATSAHFTYPGGIAFDSAGTLYIADSANNKVRKVSGGIVSLVAGNGMLGFDGDGGPAVDAHLSRPTGVAGAGGSVYIADSGNNRIRKVAADGTINTVAGSGGTDMNRDGVPATQAGVLNPGDILLDGAGNLYITDTGHGRVLLVVGPV